VGAVTDSAYSDAAGYYQIDLSSGSYGVFFSNPGYVEAQVLGQHFFESTTLPDVTLFEPPPGIQISDSLSGQLEDTTYVVIGEVIIGAGDSLEIQPGTTVWFAGRYDIEVYGHLTAVGTESDSIYFLTVSPDLYWGSIIFRAGSSPGSELSHCHISGAGASAVNCYYTDMAISHCTITGNRANWGGGIYCSSANVTISDCSVTGNLSVNNGGGIYCTHASPLIINCTVTGNASNQFGGGSGRGGGGICANHSSNPTIESCTVEDNYTTHNGGGISINDNSHAQLIDCMITDNVSDSSGGGVFVCAFSNVTISGCDVTGNQAWTGGGFGLDTCDSLSFDHCLVSGNSALHNGGGIACYTSNPDIENCTVYGNAVDFGSGIYCENSQPGILNTIIAENTGVGGIYFADSLEVRITYCDIFSNVGGDFAGLVPSELGVLTSVNLNGDSSDVFFNIFLNPLFVNPAIGDFQIQADSPCIDAGDPESPYDPDGTVADIGAFYFDQGTTTPVSITMTPINPPITIPASGGSFDYFAQLDNISVSPVTFEVWVMVQLPAGQWYGPVLGPVNLTLPGETSLGRRRIQSIPANAPPGSYLYEGRIGSYPGDVWDTGSFTFEKLTEGEGAPVPEWSNSGEELALWSNETESSPPVNYGLMGTYPNPFNGSTVITFQLPVDTRISLEVFDVSGRQVAELVNGWRVAGAHRVTLDGSDLSTGVYVVSMRTGSRCSYSKILLLK
jgi:parallel beta-helix repeat protein/predicted outer membrane repeat protein